MAQSQNHADRENVTSDNLSLLGENAAKCAEARICELSFLADGLTGAFAEIYGKTKSLSEAFAGIVTRVPLPPKTAHVELDSRNRERIEHFLKELSVFDKAVLTDLLCEKLPLAGIPLTEREFLSPKEVRETIGYVRNALADEAFDVFSEEMKDPRVTYVPSFKEGVSALLSGKVGYLLLPLEERGGVRLFTVEKLLRDNDLKIAGVTPVFGFDGNAGLTYALVSTSLRLAKYGADDDRYLEIRLPKVAGALGEFLMAVRAFGVEVFRIGTSVFDEDGESESYYSVVFKRTGGDFSKLLCYLSLFERDYTPVGVYLNLEI